VCLRWGISWDQLMDTPDYVVERILDLMADKAETGDGAD
jgi:hypothetical protein